MVRADRLNEKGRDAILAETNQMRQAVIDFAHKALVLYLGIDKDKAQDQQGSGTRFEYFVLAEMLHRPEQEPRMALALRLESPVVEGAAQRNSLTILRPVPEDVDFSSEDFEPTALPQPDVVYFIYEKDGVLSHFAVSHGTAFFYVPSDRYAPQADEFDAFSDINAGFDGKIVQSGLPFLASLHEDLVNMRAVSVRRNVFKVSPDQKTE